jgi:hypothetical protein
LSAAGAAAVRRCCYCCAALLLLLLYVTPPSKVGSWYDTFEEGYADATGKARAPGSSTSIYKNHVRASTLWYHDHT